jgi:hypothetical protein
MVVWLSKVNFRSQRISRSAPPRLWRHGPKGVVPSLAGAAPVTRDSEEVVHCGLKGSVSEGEGQTV